jgi:hypothetical protein
VSNPKELLEAFDAGMGAAWKALNALKLVSVDNVDLLDLYKKFEHREACLRDMETQMRDLSFAIGAQRHHLWATSDRFYVYVSERYGKPVEASLGSLGEASGSSWHDLHFAAKHWQRMEEASLRPSPHRKGEPARYWIMAYSPNTGQIRKLTQAEIDAALAKPGSTS